MNHIMSTCMTSTHGAYYVICSNSQVHYVNKRTVGYVWSYSFVIDCYVQLEKNLKIKWLCVCDGAPSYELKFIHSDPWLASTMSKLEVSTEIR